MLRLLQNVKTGRLVGIDVGTKRVGIAVADPLSMFAQPLGTFSPAEALAKLRAVDAAEGIATVVVGWPLDHDGEEGPATKAVDVYLRGIRDLLPTSEIVKWDEYYTSEIARERIRASGGSRRTRADKSRVDAAAAGIVLQEYLDFNQQPL